MHSSETPSTNATPLVRTPGRCRPPSRRHLHLRRPNCWLLSPNRRSRKRISPMASVFDVPSTTSPKTRRRHGKQQTVVGSRLGSCACCVVARGVSIVDQFVIQARAEIGRNRLDHGIGVVGMVEPKNRNRIAPRGCSVPGRARPSLARCATDGSDSCSRWFPARPAETFEPSVGSCATPDRSAACCSCSAPCEPTHALPALPATAGRSEYR